MAFLDKPMKLFGLNIEKIKPAEELSAGLVVPDNQDGADVISSSAAYYGIYMDTNAQLKNEIQQIQKYREVSQYPEVDIALQDIINESIPNEDDENQLDIILDETEFSDELNEKITEEFKNVLRALDYENMASDIFRRWYVDGRLFYQIIVDKSNLKRGIIELRAIDSVKIRKIKEVKKIKTAQGVEVIGDIEEYYVYNEAGIVQSNQNQNVQSVAAQGLKISVDAIAYAPSGLTDPSTGTVVSYLNKAIRPINQLRMLEDATVVYFIARAPERRIFYVDVGNLPKMKAEQYMKEIMNRYRNKMVYDAKSGEVKDDKKYMSMLEDMWMPRRDGGKGTEVQTLAGATNQASMLENVEYFQKKMYQALNVPISRMQPDTGFSLGRTTEISRDELKFQKFVDRLRRKFSQLFFELLKTQLILKGICNDLEWDDLKEKIKFRFQRDNFFSELKNQDLLNSRLMALQQINQFVGNYYSKDWIWKNVLKLTEKEIEEMKIAMKSEEGDETAQFWNQQQLMQPPMPPGMGGDPNDPNADPNMQQDPYDAPGGQDQDQQQPQQ